MRDRIQSFIDHARALVLLAAGAGILFSLDSRAADTLAPKTFFFAAGTGFFVALTAMRLWWGAKFFFPRGRASFALLAIFATQLLSFLASPARARSEAAFNAWLLAVLLGLAAYDWLRQEERQRYLLYALSAALGAASLWALAQAWGIQLSQLDQAAALSFGRRASASFGNPNFLAGFLVLSLPCALVLAFRRPAAWALIALGAIALLATGSKAAWLGLGFQFFALGHLSWHSTQPRPWRLQFLKYWAILGLAVGLLGLALLPHARTRLLEALNPRHESFQFRLQTWKGSFSAFAARPILGHGPGSFSAVYPAHRPPAAMASQRQHSYEVTHPENWVMQLSVENGLLGLAAFAIFLWLLLKPLWHAAKSDAVALSLFLALAGSLICNLASLDLFLPSTFFFFTLLAALSLQRYGSASAGIGIKAEPYAAAMLSACLLFLATFPALQSLSRWRSSQSLAQAKSLSQAGKFEAAIKLYDESLQGDPINHEALYFKGASLLDSGKPAEALKIFDELQTLAPDFVLVHDKRARAYKALKKFDEAAIEWNRQLELDPWLLPAVQELSGLYATQGKLAEAVQTLENATARFPENADISKNLALLKKALQSR